ncbi:MAG: PilZ domain-containing protein [Bythopirellula sp.]
MPIRALDRQIAEPSPEIQCGHCTGKLPLRMSQQGERGVVWLCAECSVPFVSLCIKDRLPDDGRTVKLDDRYFDTDGLPPISAKLRREVMKLAERAAAVIADNQRRSERVTHSLVVPAVKLDAGLNPVGQTFQVMVANVSREGVGLVHNELIDSEFIAMRLPLDDEEPIQVVARLVRERELKKPLREFGGEFFVRLGSVADEE